MNKARKGITELEGYLANATETHLKQYDKACESIRNIVLENNADGSHIGLIAICVVALEFQEIFGTDE